MNFSFSVSQGFTHSLPACQWQSVIIDARERMRVVRDIIETGCRLVSTRKNDKRRAKSEES